MTPYGDISRSTMAHVMACCLTAPSQYLNQCWLIFSKAQWHSNDGNLTRDNSHLHHYNKLENCLSKILFKSPRGQWGKSGRRNFTTALHDPIYSRDELKIQLLKHHYIYHTTQTYSILNHGIRPICCNSHTDSPAATSTIWKLICILMMEIWPTICWYKWSEWHD